MGTPQTYVKKVLLIDMCLTRVIWLARTRSEAVETEGQLSDHSLQTVIVESQCVNLRLHVLKIIHRHIFLAVRDTGRESRCCRRTRGGRRNWYILVGSSMEAEELIGVHGQWPAWCLLLLLLVMLY